MKSLEKIIQEKTDLIASSDDEFISSLSELLPDNANELKKYIADLDTSGGKLVSNAYNRQKLIEIRKFLIEILRKDYNINFNAYIKRFEDIAGLNVEIQAIQGIEINASEFGFAKKIMTDLVADQLSLDNVVDQTVRPGIQQILYKHVMGGYNRKDATSAIETFLKDKEYIKRWSKVVARDTVADYDGMIQDQLTAKYDYEGYFYTGTIIETSRPQCRRWVEDLGGFITMDELRKEVERFADAQGYDQNKRLTVQDFGRVRGGYSCRHTATAGFMSPRIRRKKGL